LTDLIFFKDQDIHLQFSAGHLASTFELADPVLPPEVQPGRVDQ